MEQSLHILFLVLKILSISGHYLPSLSSTADDCIQAENPFGTCTCDGQFFMNHDCSLGFTCVVESKISTKQGQFASEASLASNRS